MSKESATPKEWVVRFRGSRPRCCEDRKMWLLWLEANRERKTADVGFCEDCQPTFALEKRREGLCENPRVRWKFDADGWVAGRLPKVERKFYPKAA